MTWKRCKGTHTRPPYWITLDGRYVVQLSHSGDYEAWHDASLIGSAGLLGGAKNLCEIHSKGIRK